MHSLSKFGPIDQFDGVSVHVETYLLVLQPLTTNI